MHFIPRSYESIKNRVSKFISKISPEDEMLIQNAAKETPDSYIHFGSVSHGEFKKRIIDINSVNPHDYSKLSNGGKSKPVIKASKSKASKENKVQKLESYFKRSEESVLKKRIPESSPSKPAQPRFNEPNKKLKEDNTLLGQKMRLFLSKLDSRDEEDVERNGTILNDFIKHFSFTFSSSPEDLLEMLNSQVGENVSVDEIRKRFVKGS